MCHEYCCYLNQLFQKGKQHWKCSDVLQMRHSDPSEKLHFNDLNFIQPPTSNKIFRVLDFSLSAGVASWYPLGEIKLFSFICTCFGCAGRAHARKCHLHCVYSQCRSPSCVYFGSPQFALLRCATAFPWHYTSHKSDTDGKCLPTAARTQQCPGAAGPNLCLMKQLVQFWASLKQTGKQLPIAKFEISYYST